jgi:hypothetical protein
MVKIVLRMQWLTSASILFPFIWRGFAMCIFFLVNVNLIIGKALDIRKETIKFFIGYCYRNKLYEKYLNYLKYCYL